MTDATESVGVIDSTVGSGVVCSVPEELTDCGVSTAGIDSVEGVG